MRATSHSTLFRTGSRNERDSGNVSLGHAGKVVKAMNIIDLPRQFAATYRGSDMKRTLAN